jgi:hypothetical protein
MAISNQDFADIKCFMDPIHEDNRRKDKEREIYLNQLRTKNKNIDKARK